MAEQKHIESCRAEDPLAQTMEACGNESDIQAALQPLLVETMPGYVPVPTTAPTSPIAELPNVLISIIRRVATKPLAILGERPAKQSLLGTLLATWNAIRQRLAGNPSLGIPDRRADMSGHSLPTALALLSDRKITNGGAENDGIADGMSLGHLLCDTTAYNAITEIRDDNSGWTMDRPMPRSGLSKITLGCETLSTYIYDYTGASNLQELSLPNLKSCTYMRSPIIFHGSILTIPNLESISGQGGAATPLINGNVEEIYLPKLKSINSNYGCVYGPDDTRNAYYNLKVISMPSLESISGDFFGLIYTLGTNYFANCATPHTVIIGTLKANSSRQLMSARMTTKLLHFEIGAGTAINLNLSCWTPDAETIAHQDFLENFREFIAERLAKYTGPASGKPLLTLSQAVRNAIEADGIASFIKNDRNWEISPEPNNQ